MNPLTLFFRPNRYSIIGFILLFLGFFLIPFFIGFFIMPIGIILFVFGIHYSIYKMIPGHEKLTKKILDSYKPYFHLKKLKKVT